MRRPRLPEAFCDELSLVPAHVDMARYESVVGSARLLLHKKEKILYNRASRG